jgi:hypothetical protein
LCRACIDKNQDKKLFFCFFGWNLEWALKFLNCDFLTHKKTNKKCHNGTVLQTEKQIHRTGKTDGNWETNTVNNLIAILTADERD